MPLLWTIVKRNQVMPNSLAVTALKLSAPNELNLSPLPPSRDVFRTIWLLLTSGSKQHGVGLRKKAFETRLLHTRQLHEAHVQFWVTFPTSHMKGNCKVIAWLTCTVSSISMVTNVAGALIWPGSVGTFGIWVTSVSSFTTLVNVWKKKNRIK